VTLNFSVLFVMGCFADIVMYFLLMVNLVRFLLTTLDKMGHAVA
jgi:hypothetical protein